MILELVSEGTLLASGPSQHSPLCVSTDSHRIPVDAGKAFGIKWTVGVETYRVASGHYCQRETEGAAVGIPEGGFTRKRDETAELIKCDNLNSGGRQMFLVEAGRELPSRGAHCGRQGSVSIERTVSLNPGMIMSKTNLAIGISLPSLPNEGAHRRVLLISLDFWG